MFGVVLIFGDVNDLADFVLSGEMSGVEVNSSECTLTGVLTKVQVDIACKDYGAYVRVFREITNKASQLPPNRNRS